MRILIDAVGIRGHGAAAVLQELLYWLPRAKPDWEWQVFMLPDKYREFTLSPEINSVDVFYSSVGNSKIGRLIWVYFTLPKLIREHQPDVVFSLTNIGKKRFKQPLVIFLHRSQLLFKDSKTTKNIFKSLKMLIIKYFTLKGIRDSQHTIVQTEAMKKNLNEKWDFGEKIQVIPSGYHTLYQNNSIRDLFRTKIDTPAYPKLIYVSYPSEHKNHEILVKALPELILKYPDIKLYLTLSEVNPGNRRFQKFSDHLIHLAKKLDVYDYIIWLGGISPAEVMYAFKKVDLHVFPSLLESFGLGIAESMAVGCPVLIADREYGHNVAGEAGWFFNPHEPKSLVNAVKQILNEESHVKNKIILGNKRVKKYSYKNISNDITKILCNSKFTSKT